ncbi:MAG: SPOR domain-containing protein [Bacteroidales bacterium]|nr:SPOR domain-containing protein [Bacteroidales bacterium]
MNNNNLIKKIFLPIVVLLAFILSTSETSAQQHDAFNFGILKNKSYYTTVFSQAEQIELAKADEDYLKGKTELLNAEKNFKKADGYYKISKNYGGKTEKKATRYEKKAIKSALKAYDYFFKASDRKFHIYSDKLKKMENNNSKKHLKAEELGIDARSIYMSGTELNTEAKSLNGKTKVNKLEEAFNSHLKAINQQETAFGIFMNDTDVEYNETNDAVTNNNDTSSDNNLNDNTENNYKPDKDPNIYISKEESIIAKLNISNSDKSLLDDASDKRTYAETLMKEVDADYLKIDKIRNQADNIDDEYEKDLKNKMASGLEKVLFEKMIKAAKLFFEAGKMKYEVYAKYLPEARNSKNFQEGKIYEDNASSLHSKALKIYNKANFYSGHQSNLYIQLMNAVQTELSAIQEQENAFSTYFKLEVTPLEENVEVIVENNNQVKTNDNKNSSSKLTYNYRGSFVYSKYNPEPIPLVHKEGIIFKVQLGLFKGLLPLKKYGKYSPISYDTFKNNPYRRFLLGEYRSYKAAEYVLNQVVTKGLTDPFIVTYENGERKTATYGISKIVRNDEFEKTEAKEMSYLTGNAVDINTENNTNNYSENNTDISIDNTKINKIKEVMQLVYCVQLGNFSSQKKLEDFKGAEPVFIEKTETSYRYMTGTFSTYNEAKEKSKELTSKGFEGTFVIAYYKGEKISLNKAKSVAENETIVNTHTKKDEVYFAVQIGAYSSELEENEMNQFASVSGKYKINTTKIDGGLYLYTIGKYKTYKEAAEVKDYIKSMSTDGFVIAFKNGNRISAQDAIKFLKHNK